MVNKNVQLDSGFISFKNYSRQILAPFKSMQILNVFLKKVDVGISNNDVSYTRNIKTMFLVLLLINLCVSITDIAKKLFRTEEEMLLINSLNQFLMSKTTAEE